MQSVFGQLAVGFDRPFVFLSIPVLVGALWYLILNQTAVSSTGRRPRVGLFSSRLLIVVLLVTAAAGPYTVTSQETAGDPRVTILSDESASTAVGPEAVERLETDIEAAGVPVSTVTIARENTSRLGDGVMANLRPDGHVVLVSDGQTTGGETLQSAGEFARGINATISAVPLEPTQPERYVTVHGPRKTTPGVENRFLVRVGGVNLEQTTDVGVRIDGDVVRTEPVTDAGSFEVVHEFSDTGAHRIVAELQADDRYAVNDVFYKTIRVVEQPRILYVSESEYPLFGYLSRLYSVDTASNVPSDLSPYYAVVIQNMPASEIGDVDALQRFTVNGNGVVVVGGPEAFEAGGYEDSTLGSMLPVTVGEQQGREARIILAVDVSGSAEEGMRVQKALALDALNQLGDDNQVGLLAFNQRAHRIANLTSLESSRSDLEDKIRRLQAGGATSIADGIQGAASMLGNGGGAVILISDGWDKSETPIAAAQQLGEQGIPVIAIGVGEQVNGGLLRNIASESGGTYFTADETSRLRILFGDQERQYESDTLTVVDETHFITTGVELTAGSAEANQVAVKTGADYLVASGTGSPAVAAWRYGLGRVVSVTAYAGDGSIGGLLSRPDSLLVTKGMNWAIGDPERKDAGVTDARDTRVGVATTITYNGEERPTAADVRFRQVGERSFEARVVPREAGFQTVRDATFAVNYPEEYAGFGTSQALHGAVQASGGRVFEPTDGAAIAEFAQERSIQLRETRQEWDWVLLVVALVVFLIEIAVRRLLTYRGVFVP